jgi:hypothetical protein
MSVFMLEPIGSIWAKKTLKDVDRLVFIVNRLAKNAISFSYSDSPVVRRINN